MNETGKFAMKVLEGPKGFWLISPDLCKGCGLCPEKCPTKVIKWSEDLGIYGTPMVTSEVDGCIACQNCQLVCPDAAIKVIPKKNK
ncbi:MAG: ferredoxin family protein [bacterium]